MNRQEIWKVRALPNMDERFIWEGRIVGFRGTLKVDLTIDDDVSKYVDHRIMRVWTREGVDADFYMIYNILKGYSEGHAPFMEFFPYQDIVVLNDGAKTCTPGAYVFILK